jgi:two-component system response regulator FixJ
VVDRHSRRSHIRINHSSHILFKDTAVSSQYVHVVDDDRDVRLSISFMLGAVGFESRPFASGQDFIDALADLPPGAILLDIRMPEMDGFQVMSELAARGIDWPVVVMTGHGEVAIAVRAMKLGAIDFIEKPFGEEILLSSLHRAFELLKDRGEKTERKRAARGRVGVLTARELEVLQGLMAGLPNKLLARRLGISLRTVEMHRANMMERLQVSSLAEALTLAVQAEIEPLEQERA